MSKERIARMIAIDAWFEARQGQTYGLEFYMVALAGELGEAAELVERVRQDPDYRWATFLEEFAPELADCEMYLRHLARKAEIWLPTWAGQGFAPARHVERGLTELTSRVGEAANLLKKRMRGDDLPEFQVDFSGMVAECEIYLRRLAGTAGIDLDAAVDRKLEILEQRCGIPRAAAL